MYTEAFHKAIIIYQQGQSLYSPDNHIYNWPHVMRIWVRKLSHDY
jgi:hypothetical protein